VGGGRHNDRNAHLEVGVLNPAGPPVTARQVDKRTKRLPVAHRFRLAWRLSRDPAVPRRARLLLLALFVYLASPLDIIPDFIPVIGLLDDLLVAGIAVWWFLKICPPAVAVAQIERLEATPLGTAGRLLPWLLAALFAGLVALFIIWLLRR
jgi:uncharacterized membrane protein YkvA (DUF1232 family)